MKIGVEYLAHVISNNDVNSPHAEVGTGFVAKTASRTVTPLRHQDARRSPSEGQASNSSRLSAAIQVPSGHAQALRTEYMTLMK
jgi:hypothetical protein